MTFYMYFLTEWYVQPENTHNNEAAYLGSLEYIPDRRPPNTYSAVVEAGEAAPGRCWHVTIVDSLSNNQPKSCPANRQEKNCLVLFGEHAVC